MSKPKPIPSVIRQMYGAQTSLVDLFNGPECERFPSGGGWAVTVTRGPRARRAFPNNVAKRDAAVADLKQACQRNRILTWGTYENQRSRLSYTHDDADCPSSCRRASKSTQVCALTDDPGRAAAQGWAAHDQV